jgi:cytosine/adenosine deaminase-related metal-dependent hydrolase
MPVHNTFTREADILFAEASPHRVFWCLCPNANAYIENCMPPVDLLLKHRAKIVLGTDSLASNHQLSILEEIKTLQVHFPDLLLEEILSWATSNGAGALDCQDQFGSFEAGKYPGIVNIFPAGEKNGLPALTGEAKAQRVN